MSLDRSIILGYYLIIMTGLFFLLFKPAYTPPEKREKETGKTGISRKIVYFLNNTADRAGRSIAGPGCKGLFTMKRRILEVLEYEKDIHITPAAFMGYKSMIALLLIAAGALLGNSPAGRVLLAGSGAAVGFFIPDIMVRRYSANVSGDIEKELPYVIDLMRVSSLSGQNIYNSFKMLAEKYNGRICGDIKNFLRDIDMGAGKDYAYKNLIMASRSEQFRDFINVLMEADIYGSPVDGILSRRSVQINQENWDNAEKKAKRKGLLTLLPLVFLILPAFVLLVGGPLIFSVASGLFQ